MKSLFKKQQGLTMISIVVILAAIGFCVMLVLKIIPIYLDNGKVAKAVATIKQMPDISNKSKKEIENSLSKYFEVDNITHVTDEDITILAQPGYVKLDIDYERVEPIVGNLSILVQFHEGFEVGGQ